MLTYKQLLLKFAAVRKLKRAIFIVPVMTPRLSSYWLYFVTSTSYSLAVHLVNSMKVEVICKENRLREMLNVSLINYEDAISLAFDKIERHQVESSWKDALTSLRPRTGSNGGWARPNIPSCLSCGKYTLYSENSDFPFAEASKASRGFGKR